MIILPEDGKPVILESSSDPIPFTHYWTFNGDILDFQLTPIMFLEEYRGPVISFSVDGSDPITVPASWHILVHDKESSYVDFIQLSLVMGKFFYAYSFSPKYDTIRSYRIDVLDVNIDGDCVYPCLNKTTGLVRPFGFDHDKGDHLCVVLSQSDLFSKKTSQILVGDLLS